MFVRTLVAMVALVAGSMGGTSGAAVGTAKGSMTVAGRPWTLSHVHAFPKKVFGRPAVLLVFSDVDLSAADAADDTKLSTLASAGKLHALGILIGDDPSGKASAISNEIYDQGLKGRMSIGGEDTLEGHKGDATSTSGRLFLKAPKKFENGVTFTYDVTFNAPIER